MVKIKRYDFGAKTLSDVDFDETVFGDRARVRCLREAALMYAKNLRQGTVDTRERSFVAGTTKKPWKQKHTGRARAGSAKSPIWRGGGTIFGPHPRDFGYARPRQELIVALRGALFGKLKDREVALVANLKFPKASSKSAREMFANLSKAGIVDSIGTKAIGSEASCIVVVPEHDPTTWNSMRNFPKISVRTAADLNADDILRNRLVLLTEEAATKLKGGFRGVAAKSAAK
ncbi:MAG: 50S ribosomal protein L4 [Planctomycetota bacterium]